MLDGPLVFVDIDTQHDFLDPTGALYVAGSAEILPNLRRLTEFAVNHKIPILATACFHQPDDPELEIFPPHCLAHTPWTSPSAGHCVPVFCRPRCRGAFRRRTPFASHAAQARGERFQPFRHRRSSCPLQSRPSHLGRLRGRDRLLRTRRSGWAHATTLQSGNRRGCHPRH